MGHLPAMPTHRNNSDSSTIRAPEIFTERSETATTMVTMQPLHDANLRERITRAEERDAVPSPNSNRDLLHPIQPALTALLPHVRRFTNPFPEESTQSQSATNTMSLVSLSSSFSVASLSSDSVVRSNASMVGLASSLATTTGTNSNDESRGGEQQVSHISLSGQSLVSESHDLDSSLVVATTKVAFTNMSGSSAIDCRSSEPIYFDNSESEFSFGSSMEIEVECEAERSGAYQLCCNGRVFQFNSKLLVLQWRYVILSIIMVCFVYLFICYIFILLGLN
jgi:hypothetical protein